MEKKQKYINTFQVNTKITELKVAVGLMFQKMGDSHREDLLRELMQTDTEPVNDSAKLSEQFRV